LGRPGFLADFSNRQLVASKRTFIAVFSFRFISGRATPFHIRPSNSVALTTAAVAAATMKIEPAESPIQADSDNALISRSTRLVSESSTMTVRY
jgi:hypothetical protein